MNTERDEKELRWDRSPGRRFWNSGSPGAPCWRRDPERISSRMSGR